MRPHSRANTRASGLARARMLMKSKLWWLEGYPRSDGWVVIPKEGERGVEPLSLDRNHLRRATYTANKLCGEFPRAMPKLVEDVGAWHAAVGGVLTTRASIAPKYLSWISREAEALTVLAEQRPEAEAIALGLRCAHLAIELRSKTMQPLMRLLAEPACYRTAIKGGACLHRRDQGGAAKGSAGSARGQAALGAPVQTVDGLDVSGRCREGQTIPAHARALRPAALGAGLG